MPKVKKPEQLELVVASDALDLVKSELKTLRIRITDKDSNNILGLTRIKLVAPANAIPRALDPGDRLSRKPKSSHDWLLVYLRRSLAARYNGWTPAMGKNRRVGGVASKNGVEIAGPANGIIIGDSGAPQARVGKVDPATGRPRAYRTTRDLTAGRYATVGILDTKIAVADALNGKVLADPAAYLGPQDRPWRYEVGHATFVAGLIAAQAPATPLHHTAVLIGSKETATIWELACAMAQLVEIGVNVINLSLGCPTEDNRPPFALRRAVEVLTPQALIVAAAGNFAVGYNHNPNPFWPAAFDNVVAVGAYDSRTPRRATARFSPLAPWVDLEAPGVGVVSSYLSGKVTVKKGKQPKQFKGYARWKGTSSATATVTGKIAARIEPGVSAADVVEMMRKGKVKGVRPYR